MRINRTTQRTIKMLELVSEHPEGLSLAEISSILDIPKTSAFDILRTLDCMGMIELVDERAKVYALGVKAFVIGNKYITEIDLVKVARPFIQSMGNEISKTVFIGVRNGDKVIYLDKYVSNSEISTTCQVGSENGIYCTALGKAMLAFSKNYKEEIDKLELYQKTPKTIIDRVLLYKEMEKIRRQGFAVDDREDHEHMLCAGAPIFNHRGEVIAAISTTGLYVEGKDYSYEFELIKNTAIKISDKLGYVGGLSFTG